VLDLFAGSGAFGIEALSRGAAEAVFVDNDSKSIEAIRFMSGVDGGSERSIDTVVLKRLQNTVAI